MNAALDPIGYKRLGLQTLTRHYSSACTVTHWEKEEHLGQLPFLKVVGEVLHSIGAHAVDITVLAGMF